jgi:hypothetical protein
MLADLNPGIGSTTPVPIATDGHRRDREVSWHHCAAASEICQFCPQVSAATIFVDVTITRLSHFASTYEVFAWQV